MTLTEAKMKVVKRLGTDILRVLEILDLMHEHNERGERHYLDSNTIMNCRNMLSIQSISGEELISEPLRVKILSRLMREYRRSVELQKAMM